MKKNTSAVKDVFYAVTKKGSDNVLEKERDIYKDVRPSCWW